MSAPPPDYDPDRVVRWTVGCTAAVILMALAGAVALYALGRVASTMIWGE